MIYQGVVRKCKLCTVPNLLMVFPDLNEPARPMSARGWRAAAGEFLTNRPAGVSTTAGWFDLKWGDPVDDNVALVFKTLSHSRAYFKFLISCRTSFCSHGAAALFGQARCANAAGGKLELWQMWPPATRDRRHPFKCQDWQDIHN